MKAANRIVRATHVGKRPEKAHLLKIVKMIKRRINFTYGFKDIMTKCGWSLLCCTSCCKKKPVKELIMLNKETKFKKGKGRLFGETDIVRLVTILRNFEVTQLALMSEKERKLTELQRNQVISTEDD